MEKGHHIPSIWRNSTWNIEFVVEGITTTLPNHSVLQITHAPLGILCALDLSPRELYERNHGPIILHDK